MSDGSRARRLARALVASLAGAGLVAGAGLLAGPVPAASAAPVRVPASDGAEIVAEQWIDASTVDVTIGTPSLEKPEKMRLLLPRSWSRDAARTWPVVYAYQGGNDDYLSWIKGSQLATLARGWDVIVALPEGGKDGGYTDWFNYGKGGTPKWETFHTSEVIQLVERNYHGGTRRAALGVSSGGQGAIGYAGRHPGMYRYAVSLSGLLHLTKPRIPSVLMLQGFVFDFDPYRVWGIPGWDDRNWKAHDPYELAPKLRGTGLYISAGTTGLPGPYDPNPDGGDPVQEALAGGTGELLAGQTTADFVARIKQLGIPATVHLYEKGWHNWRYWRPELDQAWPLMMASLGARKA
ncbi:alpha/beta hydrolase [Actinomadura scrupuli]|uniref:alpha/beta hydrolase n=1 Tax=Actinomadura scrupuli TaxID=559629 RepID=UPI003D99DF0E